MEIEVNNEKESGEIKAQIGVGKIKLNKTIIRDFNKPFPVEIELNHIAKNKKIIKQGKINFDCFIEKFENNKNNNNKTNTDNNIEKNENISSKNNNNDKNSTNNNIIINSNINNNNINPND
jgi:hypothetical protein